MAQDPGVRDADGKILIARINLPGELLAGGPLGSAVHVIDYDASTGTMYQPFVAAPTGVVRAPKSKKALLGDQGYHAMNAYAIVMRTLLRFELALGRRVGWGIHGHQLKIVPHAFEEPNAFYAPGPEALLFGYVRGAPDPMFLCLSHDVVAHETAHALLDGLRDKFMAPSTPDQAALHEAFADIVALLSVFSLPEAVRNLITNLHGAQRAGTPRGFARTSELTRDKLEETALLGLADDMARYSADPRSGALRRSVGILPDRNILKRLEFQEEHRRGEVLVAAIMRAFLYAWVERIQRLGGHDPDGLVDLGLVAEQGADIADLMLTMAIRAIDYTPPVHIEFRDFLSAMLTADTEVRAADDRYKIRKHLREAMHEYGITPRSQESDGRWGRATARLVREGSHFGGLQYDSTEMFRHVWRNRDKLRLEESAFTRIASIRPCVRVSPEDGFQIRETVVECVQWLRVTAAELADYGLKAPLRMPAEQEITLEAGTTLILDEYGDLKFSVSNPLPPLATTPDSEAGQIRRKWNERIQYLWERGYITGPGRSSLLATLHRERTLVGADAAAQVVRGERRRSEGWT